MSYLLATLRPGVALRSSALLFVMALLGRAAQAQDIIIKTDKAELKTKVVEVDEQVVKYKRFEEPDGPTYSIRKDEIFVILYKSGRRETFDDAPAAPAPVARRPTPQYAAPQSAAATQPAASAYQVLHPAASEPEQTATPKKYKHEPWRLLYAHSSSESGGFSVSSNSFHLNYEGNLISGFMNYGGGLHLAHTSTSGGASYGVRDVSDTSGGYSFYAAAYLPFNHFLGRTQYEHQGFFPYAQLGLTGTYGGSRIGGYYAVGADYKFSSGFGVSVQTWEFSGVGFGITFGM